MKQTYKQEVLDNIVEAIGHHLKSVRNHKAAIHELEIVVELSKVYERLKDVETEKEKTISTKTLREALESLDGLNLK